MSGQRVSIEDLDFAAQWLRAYEGESGVPVAGQPPEDDDEQQAQLRRVAAWIDAEATRRHNEARVRRVARDHNVTPARARAALAAIDADAN